MQIVFVHGRSQQGRSEEIIRSEWMGALNIGLERAGLPKIKTRPIVPFYGDLLEQLVDNADEEINTDRMLRSPADAGYRKFLGDFAAEASRRSPVNDDQLARHGFKSGGAGQRATGKADDRGTRGAQQHDRMVRNADLEERGVQNWVWVQAIIRALDENFPNLTAGGLELILRDVYLYSTDASLAQKINKIVAEAMPTEPAVVVGHSLGSVVAYNVLQKAGTPVKRYVTVGSPLAINAIKNQLNPPPTMPPHVADWYNARDPADIVALNPLTFANFPTKPSIRNNDDVRNSSENRHHITKYLDDKNVAQAIGQAMDV